MKKRDIRNAMEHMIPETPARFSQAMNQSLQSIVAHAYNEEESPMKVFSKRRVAALVMAAMLLVAAVAYAATHWQTFEALRFMTGAAPINADAVMKSNLHQSTVNGVEITVKEAGYDGKTLFIRYSYRMPDMTQCMGMFADAYKGTPEYGMEGVSQQEMQLLSDRLVGWWIDHLWINGQCVDMPENSGSVTSGSETPGEFVQTEFWRLDNENVRLEGKADISLPIGECQPLAEYSIQNHPEKYDANGNLLLPSKGMVTFTLDTADTLAHVRTAHPNSPVQGDDVTAQVSEVCYSPLMTYITLKLEGDADAIAAYKQENGEGFYSEDGQTLLWEYGGMDIFGAWIGTLELVDGSGKPLFPEISGCNGYGNEWAEFVYPYIDSMPDQLYLAPINGGVANMKQAIPVQ